MKKITVLFFMAICIFSYPVFSDSEAYDSEIKVLKKLQEDISAMKVFLEISSEYLSRPEDLNKLEDLDSSLGVMRKLAPQQVNYYSPSLSIKDYFRDCSIFSLYTDVERYSNYMDQHKKCFLESCEKYDRLKGLIELLGEDIKAEIVSCEAELMQAGIEQDGK